MKTFPVIIALVLILHGLIHLMGTVTYMKLGVVQGLTYKTTLLGGRWDLGANGIALYGALWALAAIGFVVAAVALLAGWSWYRPLLLGVALFSLALTALDWKVAAAGVVVNAVILAWWWLGPHA
ncbi:MAG TPA: ABC transporter permease [Anaerolineae bacterium]|nr:ABC transporter permease [Anaerolineae bacterium]HNU03969.1 ABC transporter permease [Anaerolineae bacterium]